MRALLPIASLALFFVACSGSDPACGACTMDASPAMDAAHGDAGGTDSGGADAGGMDAGGTDAGGMDASPTPDLGLPDLGSSDAALLPDGASCTAGTDSCGVGLSCCSPGGPLAPICMPTCTDPSCIDGCRPVR